MGADRHNGILLSLLLLVAEIKIVVARFNKKIAACWKKSTDYPRGESITEDPEEVPITKEPKRTSLSRTLKRTLSRRNLERTLLMRTLRSIRTLNDFCTAKNFSTN